MKHLIKVAWLLLVPVLAFGQNTDYSMFENFYFTPKAGHADDLEKAMSSHNKKYHPLGDYSAQVYSVLNGPNAGKMIWSMGPTTWTKIENRPAQEGHDGDWDKNIAIHIESYDATDYYKLDEELSHFPAPFDLSVLRVWMVDIKEDHQRHFTNIMKKIDAVNADSDSDQPFGVYRRQLSGTHGIDVALIWFADSLEWFDEQGDFAKRYEAKYGEGTMDDLVDDWQSIVERLDVEIWRFNPEMSGNDGKGINRSSND